MQRSSGRLLMLSGATGTQIGHSLEVPRTAEIYMSPIIHKMADGAMYIVFGSGGETTSGECITRVSLGTHTLLCQGILVCSIIMSSLSSKLVCTSLNKCSDQITILLQVRYT